MTERDKTEDAIASCLLVAGIIVLVGVVILAIALTG